MSQKQKEYREAVHFALERCQFIEATLRMYLGTVVEIATLTLADYFPVRVTDKDLAKRPMGSLVKIFSKFNENDQLQSRLKYLVERRNHVAHQSLLFTLGELGDEVHMGKAAEDMKTIGEEAKEVHEMLLDEGMEAQRLLNAVRRQSEGGRD